MVPISSHSNMQHVILGYIVPAVKSKLFTCIQSLKFYQKPKIDCLLDKGIQLCYCWLQKGNMYLCNPTTMERMWEY